MVNNLIKFLLFTLFDWIPYFNSKKRNIQETLKTSRNISINIDKIKIGRFNKVKIINLKIDYNGVSLLSEHIDIHINLLTLFYNKIRFDHILLVNGQLSVNQLEQKRKSDNSNNSSNKKEDMQSTVRGYYEKILKRLNINLPMLVNKLDMENFVIEFRQSISHFEKCSVVFYSSSSKLHNFSLLNERITVKLLSFSVKKNEIYDVLARKVDLEFDRNIEDDSGGYKFSAMIDNADIMSNVISDVKLNNQSIHLNFGIKRNSSGFFLEKVSRLDINGLHFNLIFEHFFEEHDKVKIGLELMKCSMKQILDEFPYFYNRKLYGLEVSGFFSFTAEFNMQFTSPIESSFNIKSKNTLSVTNYSDLDLNYLKEPFVNDVYDEGEKIRMIYLYPDKASYISEERISTNLKKVILRTEDPNYFTHKGFDSHGIFLALYKNLTTGKFSRGASTISMQLVKNLFLNHKKSLYRKFEEMIFTWLIEEVFLIDKKRLFEIYLNIIEFGDNIYGVEEASNYFFGKSADSLSLTESLVLAYIIPRPKFFTEALLMRSEQLKKNLHAYIVYFSNLMLDKGIISSKEFENIKTEIVFSSNFGTLILNEKPSD